MTEDYLGAGLKFPVEISISGGVEVIQGRKLIQQSIGLILGETLAVRYFLGQYGSIIEALKFEPNDDVLKSLLQTFIREALKSWEKRIEVKDISFEGDVNTIKARVSYLIKSENEADSFVYPFYREISL